jgi:hypothetical protein
MPRTRYLGGGDLNSQRPQTQQADVCILQKVLRVLHQHRARAPQLSSAAQFTQLGRHVRIELLEEKFLQTFGPESFTFLFAIKIHK